MTPSIVRRRSKVPEVERKESGLTLRTQDPEKFPRSAVVLEGEIDSLEEALLMSVADLHWLITTGGPAMLSLLGGPLARKEDEDV